MIKSIFTKAILIVAISLTSLTAQDARAGKFSFDLGYNFFDETVTTAKFSASSGGSYWSTIDIGGTLYVRADNVLTLSFDVFSALESIQETGFIFAGGGRIFLFSADFPNTSRLYDTNEVGLSLGIDLGYQFQTRVPTIIFTSLDYAPNFLTSGRLRDLVEFDLRYEIMFTPVVIGSIYYSLGYAEYNRQPPRSERRRFNEYNNSLGLGIRFRF